MAKDSVIITIPKRFYVGVPTPFQVSTVAGDSAGRMVKAKGRVEESDVKFTGYYYETTDGKWHQFEGDQFGSDAGFPLMDFTSYFKVDFETAKSCTFTVDIIDVETEEVIATATKQFVVAIGETIDELNARVAQGGTVKLTSDVIGSVAVNDSVKIVGCGYTLYGNIVLDAKDGDGYAVGIEDLKMVGTESATYGIIGQNQGDKGTVRPVDIAIDGVDMTGYSKKAIYLTNARTLGITRSRIHDNAYETMNDPNTYGDYAIDINQCGVQDSVIAIYGNVIDGYAGKKSAIKVTQRGGVGLTDDTNTDITTTENASIKSLIIDGNAFNIDGDAVDVTIGSSPNSDGTQRSYCISYPSYISATATDMTVSIRGPTDADMILNMVATSTVTISASAEEGKMKTFKVASQGNVSVSGTVFDGADVSGIPTAWVMPDAGPVGGGFLGLRRLIMHADTFTYPEGGIKIPRGFHAEYFVSINATETYLPYLDVKNQVLKLLYPAEAGDVLEDLTIILLGH